MCDRKEIGHGYIYSQVCQGVVFFPKSRLTLPQVAILAKCLQPSTGYNKALLYKAVLNKSQDALRNSLRLPRELWQKNNNERRHWKVNSFVPVRELQPIASSYLRGMVMHRCRQNDACGGVGNGTGKMERERDVWTVQDKINKILQNNCINIHPQHVSNNNREPQENARKNNQQ